MFKLPDDLRQPVNDALRMLSTFGIVRPPPDHEAYAQEEFERACRFRWAQTAKPDDEARRAVRRLAQAAQGSPPPEAAKAQLGTWLALGDDAIPHLAQVLHSDTNEACNAMEIIAELPAGPHRDRALIEALFLIEDWRPDTAIQHIDTLDPEHVWHIFLDVVVFAGERDIELQSLYWDRLFQIETTGRPLRPGPLYGEAVRSMYTHGHFAALAWCLTSAFDPQFDSPDSVRLQIEDPDLQNALAYIRNHGIPCQNPIFATVAT